MRDPAVLPSTTYCTRPLVRRCIEMYSDTVTRVYNSKSSSSSKSKDSNSKLASDLADDKWRFEELPALVQRRVSEKSDVVESRVVREADADGGKDVAEMKGLGLNMTEVERLVRWKITHGQHRPFLPGMVRKNAASKIYASTRSAHNILLNDTNTTKPNSNSKSTTHKSTSTTASKPNPNPSHTNRRPTPSHSTITQSLTILTRDLHGIGPATASLILSVLAPEHVPFMQDELTGWILQSSLNDGGGGKQGGGGVGERTKLKYDAKEYGALLFGVEVLLERLNQNEYENEEESASAVKDEGQGKGKGKSKAERHSDEEGEQEESKTKDIITPVDLEKTAYVLRHMDLLDAAERNELRDLLHSVQDSREVKEKNETETENEVNARSKDETEVKVDAETRLENVGEEKDIPKPKISRPKTEMKEEKKEETKKKQERKQKSPATDINQRDSTKTSTKKSAENLPRRSREEVQETNVRRSKRLKT